MRVTAYGVWGLGPGLGLKKRGLLRIEIRNVSKRFNSFQALSTVNLTVPSGELVALLGPSGSGKTTLLRIIAGLEFADEGTILFNGEEATIAAQRNGRSDLSFSITPCFVT